jgi:hypothetical protein
MRFAWLLVLQLGACSSTLTVYSQPTGAIVDLKDGERLVTPTSLESSVWPNRRQRVTISASGYRSLETRVPYGSHGEWVILLVPEHGPVGTWSEEDMP